MRLQEAQSILRQVNGKSYSWLKSWGLSTIKRAIYTIYNRASSTPNDFELAEDIERVIYRKW